MTVTFVLFSTGKEGCAVLFFSTYMMSKLSQAIVNHLLIICYLHLFLFSFRLLSLSVYCGSPLTSCKECTVKAMILTNTNRRDHISHNVIILTLATSSCGIAFKILLITFIACLATSYTGLLTQHGPDNSHDLDRLFCRDPRLKVTAGLGSLGTLASKISISFLIYLFIYLL